MHKGKYFAKKFLGRRPSPADDAAQYLAGYPGKHENPKANKNVQFYSNEIRSVPNGDTIENIHTKWWGNYELLERHHGYVQWLFPIREQGLNSSAQELQLHEANTIANDPVLRRRALQSYALMLDFYGMQLDTQTGLVTRSKDFKARYSNLIAHPHNNLRITRILKFLGEVGLEDYKLPLMQHIFTEVFKTGELRALKRSATDFWAMTLRNEEQRDALFEDWKVQ
eukprot:TRINITY_DN67964_c11_g2_i1.p1 TRINITY_DN67964_c11_g2~~TRINITY_DN67964_c11_g2_i1.p1  ORF type:complete len:225 (+),score=14.98 TRINITY_DN67964_c11_g2_i1:53-727(+)